jgi:primosomal protein N' (replication factor Y)
VVRVLPDVTAIDKEFDYLVPAGVSVEVGDLVRIDLHGRRVGGWVVAVDVEPAPGVTLRALAKVSGRGPRADVIELARWAGWRWAGRRVPFLRTASPERVVGRVVPPSASTTPVPAVTDDVARDALTLGRAVVRLPPSADVFPYVLAAAARGDALVLAPSLGGARALGMRLRRAGVPVAVMPRDWAAAAGGGCVVGSRAAAWAPVRDLAAVVVVDEHDEGWQEERTPTWHARDVAIERARRARVPCVLVSPCPTLDAQEWGTLLTPSRQVERQGWPMVDVVDRRKEDPGRAGLYSPLLVQRLRGAGRVLCVLNRVGRARLLACARCGELARCERCGASTTEEEKGTLTCRQCGLERPVVCLACHGTLLKNLRAGISRAREELEALAGEPVVEVSAKTAGTDLPPARIYVGTEAVLHQVPDAAVVAFLDIDQELVAPRYRAAEQALALVARAARLLGGRAGGGRLVLQTRLPHHEVVTAALHADPGRVSAADRARRIALGDPPFSATATVSGAAAEAYVEALGFPLGVDVLGPRDGVWLLRSPDHQTLCDALAATPRPPGRLRLAVDPLR